MNSLTTFALRRTANRALLQVRPLTGTIIPIDVDHYSSGWNIKDIGEFTKPGKYQIQTFNKISDKVSRNAKMLLHGLAWCLVLQCFSKCNLERPERVGQNNW